MTEAIAGVIKSLWENIKGIGFLAKGAYNGVASFFSSDDTKKVEKKTSQSLHAASQASPGFLAEFKKNPLLAIKNFGVSVYKMLSNLIAKNFACGQWEGKPHTSKCLKPLNSWDCATCGQKLNAMCGVIGYAGGEVVTAFLTGGTLNILGKVGKVTKINKLIASTGSVITKTKVGSAAAKGGLKAFEATAKVAGKVIDTIYKIPALGSFMRVMDEAFMVGFQGPKEYFAARAMMKAEKASNIALTLKQNSADLSVMKKDQRLAESAQEEGIAQDIAATVKEVKLKAVPKESEIAPTIKPKKSEEKFYSPMQRLEILADRDYKKLISQYPSPEDQEKALEIISILKNHSKKKLSKAKVIEEYNKHLKQCM